MKNWTRKEFLKASLAGGGAALLGGCRVATVMRGSPNGDIRVAVVGINNHGAALIRPFRSIPGVRIVALCDVDSQVLAKRAGELAKDNITVARYTDYRKLLDDPAIDAVVIATPNHWHSLMTVWACQAGKDVYVEKPVSHNVWEGRRCVEAAARYNRIVQAGTQSRSDPALKEAFAFIQQGGLGKILWARGLCYKIRPSIGLTLGPQPVPPTIDYDLWLGPAPMAPLRRQKFHYDWHWFWATGNGDIGNQGIHQLDICRWALGQQGLPPTVSSFGGRFGYEDDAETPNTLIALFGYEPAPLIFEVRGLPRSAGVQAMDAYRGARVGVVIQCEHGYYAPGESGGGFVYDNDGKRIRGFISTGGDGHHANFIGAMRSRKNAELRAPIEGGHISSALAHLANISHRLGRNTAPDAVREAIPSSAVAQDSLQRTLDHLAANGVDLAAKPFILGPHLRVERGTERFVTAEKYDAAYFANELLGRVYRKPFVVPEVV